LFALAVITLAVITCSNLKKWKFLVKNSGAGCWDDRGIVNMEQFFFYLSAPFSTEIKVEQNCIMLVERKLCM
jgi:hypothetical protein